MARLRTEKAMRCKRRFRFRFDEKGAETRLDEGDEEMLSADDAAYYRPSLRAASAWLLVTVHVPSRLIPEIVKKGSLTLTLSADNGLALYGRSAGRYALGLQLIED